MFTCVKYMSTLTMKVLLIILPKRSLFKSRQCNGKWKKNKQREAVTQKGKSFIGPLVWGLQGNIPCPPSWWTCKKLHTKLYLGLHAIPALRLQPDPWLSGVLATCTKGATHLMYSMAGCGEWVYICLACHVNMNIQYHVLWTSWCIRWLIHRSDVQWLR